MNYQIYNQDCIDGLKNITDNTIDFVIADLPYGCTRNKWDMFNKKLSDMCAIPFEKLWEQLYRVAKDDTVFCFNSQQPFTTHLINSNPKAFKYCWYWNKSNVAGFLNAKRRPLKIIEEIVVFCRTVPKYFPLMTEGEMHKRGKGHKKESTNYYGYLNKSSESNLFYPKNLIFFPRDSANQWHPTAKPVRLYEYLIKTYSKENDVVLDPCFGGGSSLIASLNTGRNYVGFERESSCFQKVQNMLETKLLD